MKYIKLYRILDFYIGIITCFILTVFRFIFAPFNRTSRSGERILFIELSEMGSTILAYPAIKAVLAERPGAEIFFLTFARNRSGVEILDLFDDEHILTMRDDTLVGLFTDFLRLLGSYRRIRFTACIDLELFSRFSVILTYFSGAGRRVGFHNYTAEGLYRGDLLTHKVLYNPHIHISRNFLALAGATTTDEMERPLFKESLGGIVLQPPIMPFDDSRIADYRARFCSDGPCVVVNPDSGPALPLRNWGIARYIEVIDLLVAEIDATVVLVGTDISAASAAEIVGCVARPEKIQNMVGETETIRDLIHLIEAADLFLTNDSGPGHFAVLTDTPTFIFFGPETPALYGPIGENCRPLYSGYACSPCLTAANHRQSACTRSRCLEAITPRAVAHQLEAALSSDSV